MYVTGANSYTNILNSNKVGVTTSSYVQQQVVETEESCGKVDLLKPMIVGVLLHQRARLKEPIRAVIISLKALCSKKSTFSQFSYDTTLLGLIVTFDSELYSNVNKQQSNVPDSVLRRSYRR